MFLFNVGGYYLVYWVLEAKVARELAIRIDGNTFSEDETFLIKIPVTLPYPIYQDAYEPVDGKFEHGGEYYQMVRHKLSNDTLFIVCVRNHEHKEIANAINEYVKLSNDLPGATKKALNFLGKLLKDFDKSAGAPDLEAPLHIGGQAFSVYSFSFTDTDLPSFSPPPEA